ncbi:MAG: glycosyltransferase [Bacteroidetes bacterium]|nr:glycosyltransferase [Bacteroidota bacterium]
MILQALVLIILIILLINAVYLLVFSVAGAISESKIPKVSHDPGEQTYLILIPAYKEDAVILKSVEHAMAIDYPASKFHCAVIADGFKDETIVAIKSMGAEAFVMPDDENRNKSKSIQKYLAHCYEEYDNVLVLDGDNCVERDILHRANVYFHTGAKVLQARRVAKNETNSMSRLDSLSETINNHIFRKGQRALGFSASLIGSGMFMKLSIFRMVMEDMDLFSGFDKELELRILKNRLTINYASDILVYDEKVTSHEVFVNQRRRWTYAQYFFLKKNALNSLHELILKCNIDYFNKVLQFALLPRVLCIVLSVIMIPVAAFTGESFLFMSLLVFADVFIAILLSVRNELKWNEILTLTSRIPAVFFGMVKAIVTSQQASKKFIHTPHNAN